MIDPYLAEFIGTFLLLLLLYLMTIEQVIV